MTSVLAFLVGLKHCSGRTFQALCDSAVMMYLSAVLLGLSMAPIITAIPTSEPAYAPQGGAIESLRQPSRRAFNGSNAPSRTLFETFGTEQDTSTPADVPEFAFTANHSPPNASILTEWGFSVDGTTYHIILSPCAYGPVMVGAYTFANDTTVDEVTFPQIYKDLNSGTTYDISDQYVDRTINQATIAMTEFNNLTQNVICASNLTNSTENTYQDELRHLLVESNYWTVLLVASAASGILSGSVYSTVLNVNATTSQTLAATSVATGTVLIIGILNYVQQRPYMRNVE